METTTDERNSTQELKRKNGGLRTMPFIIANETFEKVAGVGLQANMILYLQNEYNLSSATGATILFLWLAISYFTPIFGAFVSDSYLEEYCNVRRAGNDSAMANSHYSKRKASTL
ncbi:hypothetical protein GH714_039145 [Hevea brasiliensis]|uniref:Uncharacterized protein n=1 Tax=Hevea brasiliensis TaxID=3981 RepID=A0A6A6LYS1_HEVBR|nr:hypothetical protein GH714_039145 [Hevea brasiliensis]